MSYKNNNLQKHQRRQLEFAQRMCEKINTHRILGTILRNCPYSWYLIKSTHQVVAVTKFLKWKIYLLVAYLLWYPYVPSHTKHLTIIPVCPVVRRCLKCINTCVLLPWLWPNNYLLIYNAISKKNYEDFCHQFPVWSSAIVTASPSVSLGIGQTTICLL